MSSPARDRPAGDEALPGGLVHGGLEEPGGDRPGVGRVDEEARPCRARHVARDDRGPRPHRLDDGQPEALGEGHVGAAAGEAVEAGEDGVGDPPGEEHPRSPPDPRSPPRGAGDDERPRLGELPPDLLVGGHEPRQVLPGLERADGEEERTAHAEVPEEAAGARLVGRGQVVGPLLDDADLLPRRPRPASRRSPATAAEGTTRADRPARHPPQGRLVPGPAPPGVGLGVAPPAQVVDGHHEGQPGRRRGERGGVDEGALPGTPGARRPGPHEERPGEPRGLDGQARAGRGGRDDRAGGWRGAARGSPAGRRPRGRRGPGRGRGRRCRSLPGRPAGAARRRGPPLPTAARGRRRPGGSREGRTARTGWAHRKRSSP